VPAKELVYILARVVETSDWCRGDDSRQCLGALHIRFW